MTISWSSRDGVQPVTRPGEVRWWQSLRFTFALATGLLVLAIVLVSSVASLWTLRVGFIDQLREQAASQLSTAIVVAEHESLPSNATNRTSDMPPALVKSVRKADAASVRTFDDGAAMWAAASSDAGRFNESGIVAVRIGNAAVDAQLRTTAQQVLLADAGLTLLGIVGAWMIAGIATSRLRRLANSVEETIAAGSSAPVAGSDEIAVLAAAVNSAAADVQRSLERERHFAADIAHELRTPLTALVTSAHLLGSDPGSDRVRKQVTRLRRLTENLIELGRANAGIAGDLATLDDIVSSVVTELRGSCEISVVGSSGRLVDARRFRVMIDNLVRNSCVHGAAPMSIELSESAVCVRDSGPGYPRDILECGPRRFTEPGHHSGTGLGLAIVLEYTYAVGAELVLLNEPGGTVSTIIVEGATP